MVKHFVGLKRKHDLAWHHETTDNATAAPCHTRAGPCVAPTVEEAGLLSFAADNLDVLINLFGFIAIEPAKIAIPAVCTLSSLFLVPTPQHRGPLVLCTREQFLMKMPSD